MLLEKFEKCSSSCPLMLADRNLYELRTEVAQVRTFWLVKAWQPTRRRSLTPVLCDLCTASADATITFSHTVSSLVRTSTLIKASGTLFCWLSARRSRDELEGPLCLVHACKVSLLYIIARGLVSKQAYRQCTERHMRQAALTLTNTIKLQGPESSHCSAPRALTRPLLRNPMCIPIAT